MKDSKKTQSSVCIGDYLKHRVELISPAKVQSAARGDGFEKNGQAWFVATELQSDLQVEVDTTHFHLHKFPLLSRSGLLNRLVFESTDTEKDHIKLTGLPGGPDAFELAAKFCYGVSVDISPTNVATMRCAAEYLEMTDDLEEGNLITKTEAFLSFAVLASWKDSISVLQSCKDLLPWAEKLQIVQRCIESIAWKACTDPKGIRWSYTGAVSSKQLSPISQAAMVGDDIEKKIPQDWWFEDVCLLSTDYFVRTVNAIKAKGMRLDLVGAAITRYALKWLPSLLKERSHFEESFKGFGLIPKSPCDDEGNFINDSFQGFLLLERCSSSDIDDFAETQTKNRAVLENLLSILPTEKGSVPCNFLLRLLRGANMLQLDASYCRELEKCVGLQFDEVALQDLLPSFNPACDITFDVDLVYRLVQHYLHQEQPKSPKTDPEASPLSQPSTQSSKVRISKVVHGYLEEVAGDPKLSLKSFLALAELLPEHARMSDDGLYKAVDNYLRAHPDVSDADRKKLCRCIDVHKLSLDACMHASQNENLPLRMVVQVLFLEQLKLRNAITGGIHSARVGAEERTPLSLLMQFARVSTSDSDPQSSRDGWSIPHMDFRALQAEVQQMRTEFIGLKDYCSGLQQQLDKASKKKSLFSWGSSLKKLNKWKFKSTSGRSSSFEAPHSTPGAGSFVESQKPSNRWRRNSVS